MAFPFATAFGSLGTLLGKSSQSAISSIGSGLVNQLFQGMNARRQWKYQKKQMALEQEYNLQSMAQQQAYNEQNMAKQFEYQQKAWQAENEYNDPSAVRQRYEAAGISPQAALGGGATGAGLATSMDTPDSTNPSSSSPRGNGNYAFGVGDLTLLSQISTQAALADKYKADADKTRSETFDRALNERLQLAKTRYLENLADLVKNQQATEEQKARLTQYQADLEQATMSYNISAAEDSARKIFEEAESIRLDNVRKGFENEHQEEEFYTKLNVMVSQAVMYNAQANLYRIQSMKERELANVARAEFEKLGLESDTLREKLGWLKAEIKAKMPYLDERARLEVEALAAQNIRMLAEAEAAKTNAKANWRRTNHEVWQGWANFVLNAVGTVMTGGVGGILAGKGKGNSSQPTIYGAGPYTMSPQGSLQKW